MVTSRVKKGSFIFVSMVIAFLFLPTRKVTGDELYELKQQLSDLQSRITQLETRQTEPLAAGKEDVIKQEKIKELTTPDAVNWTDKIKISGDFRYRHEHTDLEVNTDGRTRWLSGSDRDRIRARLMLDAAINDDWNATFRLATGTSRAPYSANQDLEDAFSSKELWLNLAYFTWHPAQNEGLSVLGGKMLNPYYKPCKNELIWDNDLNPEGIAAQYKIPLSKVDHLFINGGGFWIDERTLDADTSLWGGPTYWKHTLGISDYFIAGASYYDYGNLQGSNALSSTWSSINIFFGNTPSGDVYKNDYDIFEAFGEYGFKRTGMPIAVFGSWVRNLVASTDEDTGWLLGAKFNKAAEPGSWELSYDYRELDADAVVGGFTESDFFGSTTNCKGHKIGFTYQWANNIQSALSYYHVAYNSGNLRDLDSRRLLADLVLKF